MINQIILSCNEDPIYSEFWPVVSYAYHKMFPEAKVHLALLTRRQENDEWVEYMKHFGIVTLFYPVDDIPEFGQAKMIRFLLAAEQGEDVCYIDDIDLFPLSKKFITDKTDARPKDHLLCVGGEVYDNIGSYPVSQMTAEGYIWKKFINPDNKTYRELMDSYKREPMFDYRERIDIINDFSQDHYFSDERLLRRLIKENPVRKFEVERGYPRNRYADDCLDRGEWKYDREKLFNHGYHNAHCSRPYSRCIEEMKPLIEYIDTYYK